MVEPKHINEYICFVGLGDTGKKINVIMQMLVDISGNQITVYKEDNIKTILNCVFDVFTG